MAREKRSFFERLTGSVAVDDYEDDGFEENEEPVESKHLEIESEGGAPIAPVEAEEQLSVDVYQTPEHIFVKANVAGVLPDNLDISITRDMVTVRGKREEHKEVTEDDFFYRELSWGTFSRTVLLPQEVDVDSSSAREKHGIITIKMPKLDKDRQTKLKVKSS